MFWNLVRYEFKNVNKWFLALYAAVLSLSVIIGIQGSTLTSTYYQDKGVVMLVFLSLVFGGSGYYFEYLNLDFDYSTI